jgi:hypothetical protein
MIADRHVQLAATTVVAACSSTAIAIGSHHLHLAGEVPASYPLSGYLLATVGWETAVAYAIVAVAIGAISLAPVFVAAGMLLPLPVATAIEIARDATGHNLLPVEIILYWIPAFVVALLAAYLGRQLATRHRHAGA